MKNRSTSSSHQHCQQATQALWCQHLNRRQPLRCGAVAEYSVTIVSPTLRRVALDGAVTAVPCRYLCDVAAQAADAHRYGAVGRGSIAEHPSGVPAPAFDRTILNGATVAVARRYLRHSTGKTADVHRGRPIGSVAIAKLADIVGSPAFRTAGDDRAGVRSPRRYLRDATIKSADLYRCFLVGRGSIAELAVIIVSPAKGRAVHDSAGVALGTRRYLRHSTGKTADVHRGQPVGRGSIAELAVDIVSPAKGRAVHDSAGVAPSCGYLRDSA